MQDVDWGKKASAQAVFDLNKEQYRALRSLILDQDVRMECIV